MKKKTIKKLLVIMNGYASQSKGLLSGGSNHAIKFANYLNKKNIEVDLGLLPKNSLQNYLDNKVNVINYSPTIPFEDLTYRFNFLLIFIYFYRIFLTMFESKNNKYDVIVSSSHLFFDVYPTVFLKPRLFFMTYVHHIISEQNRSFFGYLIPSILEKISFTIIRYRNFLVFTVSKKTKLTLIEKYKFNPKNVYVTKNGIDVGIIKKVRKYLPVLYDLAFCGRIQKIKGIYDLLEIIQKIKSTNPEIKLIVIGDGSERPLFEKEIVKRNLSKNIIVTGFVSENKKIEYLKQSKIFIFPSHEEGWGIVIGEALACRIPVVVYKLPEIIDIWKNSVGWIDCYNINQFVATIKGLLENDQKRKILISKGYEMVKRLDWNSIIDSEVKQMNKFLE